MFKKVYLIVNPASGVDYPILATANRVFKERKIEWEVFITKKKGDAETFARSASLNNIDLVVVYGGDGTVMEAARGLAVSEIPLLIVPGGTANVLSKELAIPQNALEALELIDKDEHSILKLDTFKVNNKPYVIRVNVGLFAEIVKQTKRKSKDTFGSLAYAFTAMTNLKIPKAHYEMRVDGKQVSWEGVGLMIVNIGNIGLQGVSILPEINADDGYLDIILLNDTDIGNLLQLAAGSLLKQKFSELKYLRGRKINLKINPPQSLIFDDEWGAGKTIVVEIIPKSLNIVVPKKKV